ncbi:unnamed protein product [Lactuca saligna]|uniref:Uncharacterized protein n=1 Tax=Lactuca saligna TaxID=75948 RepID=A0AA35Z8S4_LACSI|nr:unnamed protein product [Lactuca saligna]
MTCVDEHDFGMGYLETMRVVRNFGSHWGIVPSDAEGEDEDDQPADQPAPEPRPRRRNVRGRGRPRAANTPNCFHGGTMENVVRHLGVEQPSHLGYHYPICPRWSEYGGRGGDEAGTSGAHENEADD